MSEGFDKHSILDDIVDQERLNVEVREFSELRKKHTGVPDSFFGLYEASLKIQIEKRLLFSKINTNDREIVALEEKHFVDPENEEIKIKIERLREKATLYIKKFESIGATENLISKGIDEELKNISQSTLKKIKIYIDEVANLKRNIDRKFIPGQSEGYN